MISINPNITTLNHGNAYWMARISQAAYLAKKTDNSPDRKKILKDLKTEGTDFEDTDFIEVYPFSIGNAQAILVEHKQYLCIAFRGTDEYEDWLDNLNINKVELPGTKCQVHAGFLNQFNQLWDEIKNKLDKINKGAKKRPLFFTGHSLGGALATLATAEWAMNGDRQFYSTYTFGQPRAIAFDSYEICKSMFGDRFFRFHNNNDMIPRIPMRYLGYTHTGKFVYIDNNGGIHTDLGFWFKFLDKIVGSLKAVLNRKIDQLRDHKIDNYLSAITNWDLRD